MANHIVPGTGLALKDHPNFEGICFVETSYGLSGSGGSNFDGYANQQAWDNAYIPQYKLNLVNARAAFPHKLVACRANWGTNANMQSIAATLLSNKCGCGGGTDMLTADPTNMTQVLNGTVGGIDYRPQIPIPCFSETSGLGPNVTAAAFIAFAINSAKAHYFWPSRYNGPPVNIPDGWTASSWAQIQAAYVAAGGLGVWHTATPTSY
jgi:hypothetical protein